MLNVIANPFHFIDAKGRAAGAVPMEFDPNIMKHGSMLRYVGARAKGTVVKGSSGLAGDEAGETFRGGITDLTFEFSTGTVQVPNTQYYREYILAGALFAADKETAKAVGIKEKEFKDPKELLAEAKKSAITAHRERFEVDPPFAKDPPVANEEKKPKEK